MTWWKMHELWTGKRKTWRCAKENLVWGYRKRLSDPTTIQGRWHEIDNYGCCAI